MYIFFGNDEQRGLVNLDKVETIWVEGQKLSMNMANDTFDYKCDSEEQANAFFEKIKLILGAREV